MTKQEFIILLITTIIALMVLTFLAIVFRATSTTKGEEYTRGYREGMLYAYDNVVICGASPEEEGYRLAQQLNKPVEVSDIVCSQ